MRDWDFAIQCDPEMTKAYVNRAQGHKLAGRSRLAFEDFESAK